MRLTTSLVLAVSALSLTEAMVMPNEWPALPSDIAARDVEAAERHRHHRHRHGDDKEDDGEVASGRKKKHGGKGFGFGLGGLLGGGLPKLPGLPNLGDGLKLPDLGGGLPKLPGLPGLDDGLKLPDLGGGLPKLPGLSNLDDGLKLPELPGLPNLADGLKLPDLGGGLPNLDDVLKLPDLGGLLGNLPGGLGGLGGKLPGLGGLFGKLDVGGDDDEEDGKKDELSQFGARDIEAAERHKKSPSKGLALGDSPIAKPDSELPNFDDGMPKLDGKLLDLLTQDDKLSSLLSLPVTECTVDNLGAACTYSKWGYKIAGTCATDKVWGREVQICEFWEKEDGESEEEKDLVTKCTKDTLGQACSDTKFGYKVTGVCDVAKWWGQTCRFWEVEK